MIVSLTYAIRRSLTLVTNNKRGSLSIHKSKDRTWSLTC